MYRGNQTASQATVFLLALTIVVQPSKVCAVGAIHSDVNRKKELSREEVGREEGRARGVVRVGEIELPVRNRRSHFRVGSQTLCTKSNFILF